MRARGDYLWGLAGLVVVLALAAACSNRRTPVPGGPTDVDADSPPPPDAAPPDGQPADAAAASGPDAAADAGPEIASPRPDAPIGPCGVPELEPNDTYETAAPYRVGTALVGCIAALAEADIYSFTAPAGDPSGGYFRASLTIDNVRPFAANLIVRAAEGMPIVYSYHDTKRGEPIYLYWATSPGQAYHIRVGGDIATAMPDRSLYTLKVDYTKVDDPSEPNDSRENPYPLTLAEPIDAYYFAGYKMGMLEPADFFDYYWLRVPTAGPATVTVDNVADELTLQAAIYAPGKMWVGGDGSQNPGAAFTVPVILEADTPYNIQISAISDTSAPYGQTATVPKAFMQPYRLTVTQP